MMANNPAAERGLKLLEKCTLFGALEHAHPATLSPAMRSAGSTSTAIVPGGESASSCATGFGAPWKYAENDLCYERLIYIKGTTIYPLHIYAWCRAWSNHPLRTG
jgi:hypothetical protein